MMADVIVAEGSYNPKEALKITCEEIATLLKKGKRPTTIESPFGIHDIHYPEYDGEESASVTFTLPTGIGVYGEIDDNTFGTMMALRFSLED